MKELTQRYAAGVAALAAAWTLAGAATPAKAPAPPPSMAGSAKAAAPSDADSAKPKPAKDDKSADAAVSGQPHWISVNLQQPITGVTAEFVAAALEKARNTHADGVVFLLDTPGGALDATRTIVQDFLASEIPIVVYVTPAGARAGSAGVFITLAANIAAMQPGSNIGAAHPVTSSGQDIEADHGKDMAKKVENDTAAFVRSIAKERGRNQDWAEKAVRDSVSVTSDEALKLGVVDYLAKDLTGLLDEIDGKKITTPSGSKTVHSKGAAVEPFEMSMREKLLALLAEPTLAALLMMIAMGGIGMEFYQPGAIFPGIIGGICLLLGLLSTQVIPVNAGAVLLILAGGALLVVESQISVHGAAGGLGGLCLLFGTMLFVDRSSPDYHFDPGAFQVSPWLIWPVPIALTSIMLFVASRVQVSRNKPLVGGAPGLVGELGEALTEINAATGSAFVHGEYWQARSTDAVQKGTKVRVVSVDGLIATVKSEAPPSGAA